MELMKYTDIPTPDRLVLAVAKSKLLALSTITLDFASYVAWDIAALTEDTVQWLNSPLDSEVSKVGILSSPEFLKLIEPFLGWSERLDFQRMIYATTLAYSQPDAPDKHTLNPHELYQIGAITGHNVLKLLDEKLRPQSLKDRSQQDLLTLFLLVFGTILAVGYTESDTKLFDASSIVGAISSIL